MKIVGVIPVLLVVSACAPPKFKGSVDHKIPVKTQSSPAPQPVSKTDFASAKNDEITSETAVLSPTDRIVDLNAACKAAGNKLLDHVQNISYAERKECRFGTPPNQARKNEWLTAAEISSKTLQLPKGKICDLALESAPNATLHYDDILVLAIENRVIFTSNSSLLPELQQSDGIYEWDFGRVVGKQHKGGFAGTSYCLGTSSDCVIPETDQTGPVSIKLQNTKLAPIAVALDGKSSASLNLIATGDNDDGDCAHTRLDLKVTIKYLP